MRTKHILPRDVDRNTRYFKPHDKEVRDYKELTGILFLSTDLKRLFSRIYKKGYQKGYNEGKKTQKN